MARPCYSFFLTSDTGGISDEDGVLSRGSRMGQVAVGAGFLLLYAAVCWALRAQPVARSIAGNIALIASASLVPLIVLRRRRQWTGLQRLFWDIIAIAMILWIVGHLGWAYDQGWLRWHTIFSLSAGIGPLVALLARPHLGPRSGSVGRVAMTIGAYCLLGAFLYSYFALLPGLVPEARAGAQARLLLFVQVNRLVLLACVIGA